MSQYQFIPTTRDLLSFTRPQSLTTEQQALVREKIGADGLVIREIDGNPTNSKITSGTAPPSGGNDGDIYLQYTP